MMKSLQNREWTLNHFDYQLPKELIAQAPASERDNSRLLIFNRSRGQVEHDTFCSLNRFLKKGDVLVFNDVKVIPARLYGQRKSGGQVEILILEGWRGLETTALIKPARRIKVSEEILLADHWRLKVIRRVGDRFDVFFSGDGAINNFLENRGIMPLPPYINRKNQIEKRNLDLERYQTIYAKNPGAIAAPTAGLHFTKKLLEALNSMGVIIQYLTLWVGWGTFKPVETDIIAEHAMEAEPFCIETECAKEIIKAKNEKRRVIAVGTTTTRALEYWAMRHPALSAVEFEFADLFIWPGFEFKLVDGLITNFHLPKSTLLMLASAFAGHRQIMQIYKTAITRRYRFFSYGDAMLIL